MQPLPHFSQNAFSMAICHRSFSISLAALSTSRLGIRKSFLTLRKCRPSTSVAVMGVAVTLATPSSDAINKRFICSRGSQSIHSMAFLRRVFRSTNSDKSQTTTSQMNGDVETITKQTEALSIDSTEYEVATFAMS